ncbi:MAG: hypothetical protein KJ040_03320 [Gammaproteobacteria bacterium]|nr:hypothetical protein [Gammaproteobacteria bacterium]
MNNIASSASQRLHAVLFAALVLFLAAVPVDSNAAAIYSAVEAGASERNSDSSEINSDSGDDSSTNVGATVVATATACPPGQGCSYSSLPVPTWYGSFPVGAAARARTTYGSNQAQAFATGNDELSGTGAYAQSLWFDEVSFFRGLPGGTTTVRLTFSLDGEWDNYGSFMFNAGLYDPLQSFYNADAGGTHYLSMANVLVSNGGELGQQIAGGNWFNVPWDTPAALVPGAGDADGSFDLVFDLFATVNVGQSYVLYGELQVLGNDYQSASVDAFNTGRLSAVLLEEGVSMTSAAGALDNYNVSAVPLPGAGWLLGTGIAFILGRRTMSSSSRRFKDD